MYIWSLDDMLLAEGDQLYSILRNAQNANPWPWYLQMGLDERPPPHRYLCQVLLSPIPFRASELSSHLFGLKTNALNFRDWYVFLTRQRKLTQDVALHAHGSFRELPVSEAAAVCCHHDGPSSNPRRWTGRRTCYLIIQQILWNNAAQTIEYLCITFLPEQMWQLNTTVPQGLRFKMNGEHGWLHWPVSSSHWKSCCLISSCFWALKPVSIPDTILGTPWWSKLVPFTLSRFTGLALRLLEMWGNRVRFSKHDVIFL